MLQVVSGSAQDPVCGGVSSSLWCPSGFGNERGP